MTRLLISIANHHENIKTLDLVSIAFAILLLAGASLVLRYGSFKYPADEPDAGDDK